jgi:hypothetical protein
LVGSGCIASGFVGSASFCVPRWVFQSAVAAGKMPNVGCGRVSSQGPPVTVQRQFVIDAATPMAFGLAHDFPSMPSISYIVLVGFFVNCPTLPGSGKGRV